MKKPKQTRKPGGGRKLKYGEPIKREEFKCPKSRSKEFRKTVNEILKGYIKKSPVMLSAKSLTIKKP